MFVLNAEVSHPVGAALSLALPYGIAGFKNESEEGSDPGIADIEGARFDLNKLLGFGRKGRSPGSTS